MDRLATVELQLVMHNLDTSSLLALAQCSRFTLRVADAPFTWQHTLRPVSYWMEEDEVDEPWMMDWSEEEKRDYRRAEREAHPENIKPDTIAAPPANSLLRHAPISLSWGSYWSESIHVASDAEVARLLRAIPAGTSVHRLYVTRCLQLTRSHWISILSHPSIQQLRTLKRHSGHNDPTESVDAVSDVDMLSLIASYLPHLHTLDMEAFLSWADTGALWLLRISEAGAAQVRTNRAKPALSSSACLDSADSSPVCRSLIHLVVEQPRLYGSMFLEFFLSPHLRSLQTLKLTQFHAAGFQHNSVEAIAPSDYASSFAALTSLHTLTLDRVSDIDALLPHVSCAPRLRRLTLISDSREFGAHLPSLAVFTRLMTQQAPSLRCTVIVAEILRGQADALDGMFEGRLKLQFN